MFVKHATATGVVATALLLIGVPVATQSGDLDTLLALAPSPGAEALLVAHTRDARVTRRWRGLLTHDDAQVRLSAARALGATNVRSAARDLLNALARERDLAVVGELLQAVAITAADQDVLQVHAHLDRVGDARALPLLDGLAAARPALLHRHLLTANPLRSRPEWVRTVYARVVHAAPATADALDAALAAAPPDPNVIEGVIAGAAAARRRLPASLVRAGFTLPIASRHAVVAYLAATYGSPAAVRQDEALRNVEPSAASEDDSPSAQWVGELERRWLGREPLVRLDATIARLPNQSWVRDAPLTQLAVLNADERIAYARWFGLMPASTQAVLDVRAGDPPAATPDVTADTLVDVPAVMIAGALRLANCDPQARDERFASIRYRADRRPEALSVAPDPWSPGCGRVAQAAMFMAYGTPPRSEADRPQRLIRLDAEFIACLTDRQSPAAASPAGVAGAAWSAPRKTRDVTPSYPQAAIASRLQGVVGVEAVIERAGCIADARVVRPVQAMLDAAALRGVSRWTYAPTLLNGEPVPVTVNVDVTFSLR